MSSLYARLGGLDGISSAVDQFYERLRRDPELNPYFAGKDVGHLKAHMRPFIAAAVGGPALYRGRDIRSAHAGLRITHADFDRTVAHLVAAFRAMGTAPDAIDDLVAKLQPLRALIVQTPAPRIAA